MVKLISVQHQLRAHCQGLKIEKQRALNPLHPNISMDILHTGLYTFPNVLARRTCSSVNYHFPYSHDLDV